MTLDDIFTRINYTAEISYLTNTFIYEYDIHKANISVLYSKGIINKEWYDKLYGAERMRRQVFVGKLLRARPDLVPILQQGILEAKCVFAELNGLNQSDVLAIKNDALFLIDKQPQKTQFGLIQFVCKNVYTGFYRLQNLELYYYANAMTQQENLEIKGISDELIVVHKEYFYQFLKDLFYTVQFNGIEIALRLMKSFYMQYISLSLPIGYYRRFDSESMYHLKIHTSTGSGYSINSLLDSDKPLVDISYNRHLLMELQKILTDIYFMKYK